VGALEVRSKCLQREGNLEVLAASVEERRGDGGKTSAAALSRLRQRMEQAREQASALRHYVLTMHLLCA